MTIQNFGKALLLASTLLAASSQASVAHMKLDGASPDWITGGTSVDNVYLSSDPLLIWNWANFSNFDTPGAPANTVSFTFLRSPWLVSDDKYADLEFSSRQLGIPLKAGVTYTDAERSPFASPGHAGLDVSYGHHGCNTLKGDFTVKKLSFRDGKIGEFVASFNQSCDGGALMHGSFYYNGFLDVLPSNELPEPATLALLGLGAAGIAAARRRK